MSDEDFFKLPSKSRLSFFESVNIPLAFWSLLTRAVNEARWLWPCPPVKVPELRSQPQLWIKKINLLAESISETGAIPVLLSSAFLFNEKLNEDLSRKSNELYNLSALQSSQGHCSEARSLFLQARQFEQHRIQKDLTAINEGLRSLNAKWNVVEIQNLLNSKEDFVDPIHPSELGHQKIARALGAIMLK